MTIGEAAAILGHHEQTLYKAARSGRFLVVRTFGSLRVDPASVIAWLQKREA
jgi:excisionase family DNA binding protein